MESSPTPPNAIAVIGMACRFPGATTVEAFWQNLQAGVESISFFSQEELEAAGLDPALVRQPTYVRARGALSDVEFFDAAFFGLNPREAEILDVQQRLFLECAWEAVEDAGYDPERSDRLIGVYGGAGMNSYLLRNLYPNREVVEAVGGYQVMLSNDKDFLATRVAYKLNLRGPALTVQTACSTSLVAIHLACQSLLNGECDIALAGGVTVTLPTKSGYLYQEGMILSPDGHCRAFDARAAGTVGGDGVGIVVLKRLEEALQEGDTIRAIVRGSAINNDGALKAGYTAPSLERQADVIAEALAIAGVAPETISYIEAHGTGTPLGDPIEVAALTRAFGSDPARRACALGSVKTNLGHLDTAAGVAGFIKTVLALTHCQLPPSLHFEEPNPAIDFERSPFYVNSRLAPWPQTTTRRRAGVSSFGIGGTNAHVILEEAPPPPPALPDTSWQILPLSARTPTALDRATAKLADHLTRHPATLADVAYTLQEGRRPFAHRRALVARTAAEAAEALRALEPAPHRPRTEETPPLVAFLFPGQGAQHPGMASDLYRNEPRFRATVDECAALLQPHLGRDIRTLIRGADSPSLERTEWAQVALFTVEYALACLWRSWGVEPGLMLGHSLGEYVAACLAGVFSLPDALALVAARGRLMGALPSGSMLAISLAPDALSPWLTPALSLAAINGPTACVASGPMGEIAALEARLTAEAIPCTRLHTSHAFHSAMMEPMMEPFAALLRQMPLRPPTIPFLSNLTGQPITATMACDPDYWLRHLRHTVRFSDGLHALLAAPHTLLLEVGPGRTLTTLAQRHPARQPDHRLVSSLPHPQDRQPADAHLLGALGKVWVGGVAVAWGAARGEGPRRRLPLPTYPFERQRYWIEPPAGGNSPPRIEAGALTRLDMERWFNLPTWRRAPRPPMPTPPPPTSWLFLLDKLGCGEQLAARLREQGHQVILASPGNNFRREAEGRYTLLPPDPHSYRALLADLPAPPQHIVYLWSLTEGATVTEEGLERGFHSLLALAQGLGQRPDVACTLSVLSNGVQHIAGEPFLDPVKATLLGPVQVIPLEYPQIATRSIDVVWPPVQGVSHVVDALLAELLAPPTEPLVAYRDGQRWVARAEPLPLAGGAPPTRLRERGVYLITGGLGGIGLTLAAALARTVRARLVLTQRRPFPPRGEWTAWQATHPADDPTRRTIESLEAMERDGAEIEVISADVTDSAAVQSLVAAARARFGPIHGVIHAAGLPGGGVIQRKERASASAVLAPKVLGTQLLAEALAGEPPEWMVLCSSIAATVAEFGQVDYCAANAFLDAFARQRTRDGATTLAIAWDRWQGVGMAADASVPADVQAWQTTRDPLAILPTEGADAFLRALSSGEPQVILSTHSLYHRLEESRRSPLARLAEAPTPQTTHQRPDLSTAYVAPTNGNEERLADIWQRLLGVERIGIHDNFFELGGHSLLAAQVMAQLSATFGLTLPIAAFFDSPTVAALAERLLLQQMAAIGDDELARLLAEAEGLG